MQAIQVKYLPATNTQGARLKASCRAGSITEGRKYELEVEEQEEKLAYKLCNKLGWDFKLIGGTFKEDRYFVIVG